MSTAGEMKKEKDSAHLLHKSASDYSFPYL